MYYCTVDFVFSPSGLWAAWWNGRPPGRALWSASWHARVRPVRTNSPELHPCPGALQYVKWWFSVTGNREARVCGGWWSLPGSLARMDSARSQTISSLLLPPCWAEERGFTFRMVLIRLLVSLRCSDGRESSRNTIRQDIFSHDLGYSD